MKPFIKPRTNIPAATVPQPKVSPNELAVAAVAGAIADPGERAAYLDRVCAGDGETRARIERRLAEKEGGTSVPATVPRAELITTAASRGHGGGAVALVPMPDMQMTPTGQPPRHSPVPWLLATLLAAAVGALVVVFSTEKAGRAVAETDARQAKAAAEQAEKERETALANAMEAKTVAARTEQKWQESDRQRSEAETKRAAAEAEAQKARGEARDSKSEKDALQTNLEQTRVHLATVAENERRWRMELAGTLSKYAEALIEKSKFGEAESPARRATDIRAALEPAGWLTQDARYTLGAALMGKGDMAGAEKELLTAIAGMEPLLAAAGEPERARYGTAVKKLAQLYTATGRKREATDVRRKLEAPR